MLEPAAIPGPFERVFGTPHGTVIGQLAAAAGLVCRRIERTDDLADELAGGAGLRLLELRTDRPGQAALRTRLTTAAVTAAARS
jgi:2-succinyl-5-enolpyruvyl-6-hydroxy-3-cyclohexene-1-carboxylate synthase